MVIARSRSDEAISYTKFNMKVDEQTRAQFLFGVIVFAVMMVGMLTMAYATSELSSLLPAEVAGWKTAGKDSIYNRSTLFDYIDGGAELYLSYGFKEVVNRRYKNEGKPDIVVDIFDMATAPNSFGVFSQSMETVDESFGQGAQILKGLLIFWKDHYYVSMIAHPETEDSKKALATLAAQIDKSIATEGSMPTIVKLLPEHALVRESIRYFRHHAWLNAHYFIADNNLLHIDDTTEALLAKYKNGDTRTILLLVEYPNPQSAQEAYRDFVKSYLPNLSVKEPVQIEDGTWTACRLSGYLFMAVFNAERAVDATHLLDAVEKKQRQQKEGGYGK
jgi:hypothetical protein